MGAILKEFTKGHRVDIQVLRGIAVLSVLLFHAKQAYFPFGYLGVDVFFVISGFVITPLILRIFIPFEDFDIEGTFRRLRTFFIRRFFRLAPALGSSLILAVLLVALFSPSWDNRDVPHQAIATLLLVGNWGAFTFIGDYFHGKSSPIIHTWSLSAEEQIYIFLPFFFFLTSFLSLRFRKSSILRNLLLVGIISFILHFSIQAFSHKYLGVDTAVVSNALFYSPISRVWEFSLGTLAYALNSNRIGEIKMRKNFWLFTIMGASFIGIVYFLISDPWPLTATMTAFGVIYFKILFSLPSNFQYVLAWVGDRSYSIYLVHLPLMYVAKNSPLFGDSRRQFVIGLSIIASILLGSLSFSHIENRFRVRGNVSNSDKKTITKVFAIFVLLPLISFSFLDMAIANNYWGVLNIQSPNKGTLLDSKSCVSFNALAPCKYENGASPNEIDNLLVGDSHADALSNVFSQVVVDKSEAYAIWTKGNCPFILRDTVQGPEYREILSSLSLVNQGVSCLDHNQYILDFLHGRTPVRVWLTNRNMQGYRSTFSWNVPSSVLQSLIEMNLEKLANSTIGVVYIGPVPEKVYGDVPTHRLLWQLGRGDTTNFRIEDLPIGPFEDNRFFAKLVMPANITFINPIDTFCSTQGCSLGRDYQYYSDSHHLNVPGSQRLRSSLEEAIK